MGGIKVDGGVIYMFLTGWAVAETSSATRGEAPRSPPDEGWRVGGQEGGC